MVEDKILSPYEIVIKEVEKGKLDPYDIDIFYLAKLFRETAKELESYEYLREAGRFLEASTKLIKLQVEEIFPRPKTERKKITIKEIRDVLVGNEYTHEPEYDLSWLWEHEVKVGRPTGAKDKERRLTWREFWDQAESVPLHKEIDYQELAKEVRKLIKEGEFRIRTLTDFIAYLHAYMEFEDVPDVNT